MSFITRFCYRHFFKNTQRVKAHTAGNFDVRRRFEIRKKIAKFDVESMSKSQRFLLDVEKALKFFRKLRPSTFIRRYWTSKRRCIRIYFNICYRFYDVFQRKKCRRRKHRISVKISTFI